MDAHSHLGTYNFVGSRIDGYEQPTALLTKQAAKALKAVSDDVMAFLATAPPVP